MTHMSNSAIVWLVVVAFALGGVIGWLLCAIYRDFMDSFNSDPNDENPFAPRH